jgi:hypothetical protein
MTDPYNKLRPAPPTPTDELCDCQEVTEIYLAHKLGDNPVHCLICNGEIPPEKLGFGEDIAEQIAYWNKIYGSLYYLWLDSGEYEQWARDRLSDLGGKVNKIGREIVDLLGNTAEAYYLWFQEDPDYNIKMCPLCSGSLLPKKGSQFMVCKNCKIII